MPVYACSMRVRYLVASCDLPRKEIASEMPVLNPLRRQTITLQSPTFDIFFDFFLPSAAHALGSVTLLMYS